MPITASFSFTEPGVIIGVGNNGSASESSSFGLNLKVHFFQRQDVMCFSSLTALRAGFDAHSAVLCTRLLLYRFEPFLIGSSTSEDGGKGRQQRRVRACCGIREQPELPQICVLGSGKPSWLSSIVPAFRGVLPTRRWTVVWVRPGDSEEVFVQHGKRGQPSSNCSHRSHDPSRPCTTIRRLGSLSTRPSLSATRCTSTA